MIIDLKRLINPVLLGGATVFNGWWIRTLNGDWVVLYNGYILSCGCIDLYAKRDAETNSSVFLVAICEYHNKGYHDLVVELSEEDPT